MYVSWCKPPIKVLFFVVIQVRIDLVTSILIYFNREVKWKVCKFLLEDVVFTFI